MQNEVISENLRFLYVFFVAIVTSNMDPFIGQITTDCFMNFGNCFLTYAAWEFNHCCSDGMKQDFQ